MKNATADARREMWQTMVKPLFDAALVLLQYEPSISQKENLKRLWRMSFKEFLMVSQRTGTLLVEEMTNRDLEEIAQNVVEEAKRQWEQRKACKEVDPKRKLPKRMNWLRGVPNSWSKLVNTQVTPCPACNKPGVICSSWHLKYVHRINIKNIFWIWRMEICPIVEEYLDEPRSEVQKELDNVIQFRIREFEKAKQKIVQKETEEIQIQEYIPQDG